MLTTKNKLIESFLPVFNGFYETVFAPDEEPIIEEPYTYDNYEFDYTGYRTNVAKACANQIENKLSEFGIKIKVIYESISSPREYNFETDAIYVQYKLTNESVKVINRYLKINLAKFTQYIKDRYTSYDGFISHYSNDAETWLNDYAKNEKQLTHVFGAILEFIFENEQYTAFELYEDIMSDCYLDGWLKEGIVETNKFITDFTHTNYTTKNTTVITCELINYFETNKIEYDFLTYAYIERKVNEVCNEVASHTLKLF